MTDGCKGCAYRCSDHVTTNYKYCDYYGQTGKTRNSLGVKTAPGGGCALKDERKTDRRKPLSIAYGRQVEPPNPARKEFVFGNVRKETQFRLNPAEHQRRLEMYHAGYSDGAIARRSGVRAGTICEWRKKHGLPTKQKLGRPKKPERKETT